MPEHGHQVSDLIRPDLATRLWQLRAELAAADPAAMVASAGQELAQAGPVERSPAARREPRRFDYPTAGASAVSRGPRPGPPRSPRPAPLPVEPERGRRRGMPAERQRERRIRAIRTREGRTGTGTPPGPQDGSQDRSQDAK